MKHVNLCDYFFAVFCYIHSFELKAFLNMYEGFFLHKVDSARNVRMLFQFLLCINFVVAGKVWVDELGLNKSVSCKRFRSNCWCSTFYMCISIWTRSVCGISLFASRAPTAHQTFFRLHRMYLRLLLQKGARTPFIHVAKSQALTFFSNDWNVSVCWCCMHSSCFSALRKRRWEIRMKI